MMTRTLRVRWPQVRVVTRLCTWLLPGAVWLGANAWTGRLQSLSVSIGAGVFAIGLLTFNSLPTYLLLDAFVRRPASGVSADGERSARYARWGALYGVIAMTIYYHGIAALQNEGDAELFGIVLFTLSAVLSGVCLGLLASGVGWVMSRLSKGKFKDGSA